MTETKPRAVPKSVSECFNALEQMANATRGTIGDFEQAANRAASLWLAHRMVCTGWLQAIQAEPKPDPDQETSRKVMEAVGDWCDSERMRIRLTSRVLIEEVHPDELAIVDAFSEYDPASFQREMESLHPFDDCFAEKVNVVLTAEERMQNANGLLQVIARCGRGFFRDQGVVARFLRDGAGRLWFRDHYTEQLVDLEQPGRWRHFTGGSTLKALIHHLSLYVKDGKLLPPTTFGPWSQSTCSGDLWGYGKHMEGVRDAAKRLKVIAPSLPEGGSR